MSASNGVNYLFKNNTDLTLSNVSKQWGVNIPSNDNGAAYADLDNDGDLDLNVNNINLRTFIYRNDENAKKGNHYLEVKLEGWGKTRRELALK